MFALPIRHCYDSQEQQALYSLLKRRGQLLLCKNQEAARIDKTNDSATVTSIREHIAYLDLQLNLIETSIKELYNSDTKIKSTITNLTSIPGVGIVLATNIIENLPELGKMDIREVTSLLGLAPYARESGSYIGKRSIFGGKGNLRKILYMAAVSSLRCNKVLKKFYDHLIADHKPPKVALVAVMRKLLNFIHAILKNNSFWSNNYA